MGRMIWIAVAFAFLTAAAAPPAQAGWLSWLGKAAVKDGIKIENKVEGGSVTGGSLEGSILKVENKKTVSIGGGGGGGGTTSSESAAGGRGGGYDPLIPWFLALGIVGGGGWLFYKFRGKRA